MKTIIWVGLCVGLGASFIAVRADDTLAQAAASAALEQQLKEPTQPPLASDTNSRAVVVPPGKSATNITGTVSTNAVTPPTAPVAAPARKASAVVTPTVVAPATTQPAAAPATPNPIPAPVATQSSRAPAQLVPTNQIMTVSGYTYKNAHVEKVEPDGIIISYTSGNGGMAMTKLYFEELPSELRQRYEPKPKDAGP
ncbi:MAG: hypothetical protein ABSB84_08745 [Verrucomicrobiota bacterium]|jgi:hypothetical protein